MKGLLVRCRVRGSTRAVSRTPVRSRFFDRGGLRRFKEDVMKIGIAREVGPERRVALLPGGVEKLRKLGAAVECETGLGDAIGVPDRDYARAGARLRQDRRALIGEVELILRVGQPPEAELEWMQPGVVHISHLDPFRNRELVDRLAVRGVSAFSVEMIPRITRAQKMDALSSQANLAGYEAVILAACHLNRLFPMMTTPAGTIPPARVFVVGAGVAGLQAIATARRLGARVEAYDTRPVVEEQVRSLGARFVKIDVGETGETRQGYAKALSEEQLEKQRQGMSDICARADVVITTAQLFGRPAPRIISREMVARMKPGSVIVDLAASSGGNVEGSRPDEIVKLDGVCVIGFSELAGRAAASASLMYSNNLVALVTELWDSESGGLLLDLEDDIVRSCLITHRGEICNQKFLSIVGAAAG